MRSTHRPLAGPTSLPTPMSLLYSGAFAGMDSSSRICLCCRLHAGSPRPSAAASQCLAFFQPVTCQSRHGGTETKNYAINSKLPGNHDARKDGEEECKLFRDPPQAEDDPTQDVFDLEHGTAPQDELKTAAAPSPSNCSSSNLTAPRCVNGQLVRPEPPGDDAPCTACTSSAVTASGAVRLGKADPPCFGTSPGIHPIPSRRLPPPPPPLHCRVRSSPAGPTAVYPRQWTPFRRKTHVLTGSPARWIQRRRQWVRRRRPK